jgi:hypothetical protein
MFDVPQVPRAEVIDNNHFVAVSDQPLGKM